MNTRKSAKTDTPPYEQSIDGGSQNQKRRFQKSTLRSERETPFGKCGSRKYEQKTEAKMNHRNEIKSYIVRAGMTMQDVVEKLADEYDWSRSVPNLSGKLRRGSLRYGEAVELADVLGYDIVWQKRK